MIATLVLATGMSLGCAATEPGPIRLFAVARDAPRVAAASESEDRPASAPTAANAGSPAEWRIEREHLQRRLDDLSRQLDAAQQDLAGEKKTLADLNTRLANLEKEKTQLASSLAEARDQARDLQAKLAAEQVKSATLREDKQKLMSGTTTAKEEIARLQKRAGELESEQARAEALTSRLAERDQELERLRKSVAERETLAGKVAALTDKLERAKQRVAALTEELARARPDRDLNESRPALESLKPDESGTNARSSEKNGKLDSLKNGSAADVKRHSREDEIADRKPAAAETMRDADREPGKELVLRLGAAHADLSRSLEADVARGDVTVQQQRERLTISLADRFLFEAGQRSLRADGRKALRKVSDILKSLPDKVVRVEGRVDEASGTGKKGAPVTGTGWELSTTRAAAVVRQLVEDGALDAADLSMGVSLDGRGTGPMPDPSRIDIILSAK